MVDAGDEKVWHLVMFDLPVKTKAERSAATAFRNLLLDLGYERVQLSVYVRYLPLPSAGSPAIRQIKRNLPGGGLVRMINVSDHQWSTAFRFANVEAVRPESAPQELTIF
ncbi:MAG: CRISPR-associated endonuclease Cas2 [Propionibacteriaceae bacterium]|nr:CRISPR-associated endonuclease Cas2 [Propionibacteriaceae bacterium]